jgi:hypothetical protein
MESIGFKEWSSAAIPWALGFVLDAAGATLDAREPPFAEKSSGRLSLIAGNLTPDVAEPILGRPS